MSDVAQQMRDILDECRKETSSEAWATVLFMERTGIGGATYKEALAVAVRETVDKIGLALSRQEQTSYE